jgi:hypothetical protein
MRIFERLRGLGRNKTNIERRLVETIVEDLLRRIEDGTPITVLAESSCRSWCSAEENAPKSI